MRAFSWPARVYWEDTDAGGIVYYANYLRYLERARTEWLRSLGHSQQALQRDSGLVFTVVSLTVDYRRPARLDDELHITCAPQRCGGASLALQQQVLRGDAQSGELLAEASVRLACVDAGSFRPRRLPQFLTPILSAEG